jgi:predicted TIM-barrel fold metal-dependent hydrolase
MMDTTDYSARWVSNGAMAKVVESNPERFMYQPNVSPIKQRGVKAAIKELEYWVKEKNAKIFKYYPCEDTYLNDPEIYPFYEKAQELDIVLDIHTGVAWCAPNRSKYSRPLLLDDVAMDFPGLTINAFHMGLPWFDELNWIAMKCPNVYLSLTSLCHWGITQPYKFAQIIGEAMRFVGSERITWGTDYVGLGAQYKFSVVGFRDFQMPEEMQHKYGYAPLTEQDKRNIFGENLAKLLGIDTSKRRVQR